MIQVSKELEREIQRRLAEGAYPSADDLLRHALFALDSGEHAETWFEDELLKGLEGDDMPLTPEALNAAQREALASIEHPADE